MEKGSYGIRIVTKKKGRKGRFRQFILVQT